MGSPGVRIASAFVAASLLLAAGAPVLAQAESEYERPPLEEPVRGYERSDGILVLDDQSFCSYLLGALWGERRLTDVALIDRSRRQRKAKRRAIAPASHAATLETCAQVLNAFRDAPADPDALPAWARENPVVPEALARFLPADPATDPLATPPPLGDGGRTSGFGDRTSAPFALQAGDYYVEPDAGTCESWTATLRSVADPARSHGPVEEATYLYAIEADVYRWDVVAGDCDWSVDLAPRPMAEMPALVGTGSWVLDADNPEWLRVEDARAALDAAGLVVGSCEEVFRFPFAPERVIEQDPVAGTHLEFGSRVRVVVRDRGCDVLTATE